MLHWPGWGPGTLLALSLLTACAGEDPAAGSPGTGDEGLGGAGGGGPLLPPPDFDFSAWDAAVEAYLEEQGLVGASAAVVHPEHGIVHRAGYGAFDAERIYLIASSSKILSVGVLMRLADQGLLDVDAPISDFVEWGDQKSDITVAQLVSNSSGMPGLLDDPVYGPYICQYIDSGTLTDCARTIYTADDVADRSPPDTEFRYGGGQWQLAGGIAEVVSGKPWETLVRETYVEPCGATSLGYTNQFLRATSEGGDGVASALGYPGFFQGDPANAAATDNPNIEGGAYVTAEDYGKILWMHLRGGTCGSERVLSEEAVARMQEDRIGEVYGGVTFSPVLEGYGMGWWVSRQEPGLVVDGGAYGAIPWLDLPRGYGAVVFIEGNSGLGQGLMSATKAALDAAIEAAD
jgi:CubicO group peptidase (beta-lactamase class C family)